MTLLKRSDLPVLPLLHFKQRGVVGGQTVGISGKLLETYGGVDLAVKVYQGETPASPLPFLNTTR